MNDNFEDYDSSVLDIDEVKGTDIKINPDYYIHNALIKAQQALTKDNMKEGFIQYRVFIEHIETLCRASKMLPGDFDERIKSFLSSKEYKDVQINELTKGVRLADFKLGLMMEAVFKRKTLTDPLKSG